MILICTPARDVVQATYTYDLAQLIRRHDPLDIAYTCVLGPYIPQNRLSLVETALVTHASHVLFIDGDMRFPVDTIDRLRAHGRHIVGANCRQRTQDQWTARRDDAFISSIDKTGLEDVDTLGFGVTLIDMNVFKTLSRPWFVTPYDMSVGKLVGEDVYFSHVAREAGFGIAIDHDLSQLVKHTGAVEF